MILLDTNLLARLTRSLDPQAAVARAAVRTLLGRGEQLIVVPQTCTNGGDAGAGAAAGRAEWPGHDRRPDGPVGAVLSAALHLPDRDTLSDLWLGLVEAHWVTGFRAHDVRLVAAMQSYGMADWQRETAARLGLGFTLRPHGRPRRAAG